MQDNLGKTGVFAEYLGEVFDIIFEKAEIAMMTSNEHMKYFTEQQQYWDTLVEKDRARTLIEEVREEVREEGRAEGRAKEKMRLAKEFFANGASYDLIKTSTGMTDEELSAINISRQ